MIMYYGDKREAKVKIMSKLVDAGWKVYGYTPDESDFMTDYYSPAHWSGIATKNGYVLLIDIAQYNLSDSGREIRKYDNSNKKTVSNSRIQKLTAMMNDQASTENEKASCAVLIEKELEKANIEPSYTVEEIYPTFSANPKGSTWHIEKDGQIIAKGKGVFSTNTYDWENKEKSSAEQKEEKINTFVERIEKVLNDSDALQPVVIKVPVKVTKMVERDTTVVTSSDIKEGFTFIMKVGYTHGKNKGNKYSYIKDGLFSKLGKNNKPSKSFDKMWSMSVERINELLGKGHIAVIEFEEVTEYEEKTVFKKTARKQPKATSAIQIETTEEITAEKQPTEQPTQETQGATVTVKLNEELNGIELYFSDIPSVEIRDQLKSNGFRWSRKGFWYAKQSEKTLSLANSFNSSEAIEATATNQEPTIYPEIDINDLEQYIVTDELQNRLHSASLFSVDYKKDCKETFEQIQNAAIEVLSLTDNPRIQHNIKKYLQSFKKRYYEMYLKLLTHKANNPGWAVTGRGGINVRRYNKMQDRYGNMLSKSSEMINEYENRLDKFKNEIRKEEQRAFEADLNKVTSNISGSAEFTTETKQLDYMGIKQKVRTYNYNGFIIAKTWGCYRVFKNGKEIDTNLKTTSKLDDAKHFVLYLDHKEKVTNL